MHSSENLERRRRLIWVLIIALAIIVPTLYSHFSTPTTPQTTQPDTSSQQTTEEETEPEQENVEEDGHDESDSAVLAIQALGQLAVRDRMERTGYSRDNFSPGWARVDGCDMRNRILQRDLENIMLDGDNCTVLSGVLINDPFTGLTIHFKRGRDTSRAVQIEHLVAVSDAWQKGAQYLSYEDRHAFYNDPLNLIAVDGPANMQKGDADASDWLPVRSYQCRYVARQIAVKIKYALWVTRSEHNAMKRVLHTCPTQLLPMEAGRP